ncbi:MAG: dihydrodipicolinate synthase family protein [Thermodesulfobacteriota bacterium]
MEKRYQGVYPVVFTPLTTDGAVDVPALQRIVEYLIEKGVHGLLILGSNGESPFLTDGERRQVITATVEACDGRVPVVVGTTHMGTDPTLELGAFAREAGADALLSALPIYYPLEEEDVFDHYRILSERLDMPILYYNFPMATHLTLSAQQIHRLSTLPNIRGVKESIADLAELAGLVELTRDMAFDVHTGTSINFFFALQSGAHGVICPIANLIPDTLVSLWDAFHAGDMKRAEEIQFSFPELVTIFASTMRPHAVMKEAMRLLGHELTPVVKGPLPQLTDEQAKFVRENLVKAGLIEGS